MSVSTEYPEKTTDLPQVTDKLSKSKLITNLQSCVATLCILNDFWDLNTNPTKNQQRTQVLWKDKKWCSFKMLKYVSILREQK
jgi:hypothetical protein